MHEYAKYAFFRTLPDFVFPDFIRTNLIWNGPNSALKQSAEKRENNEKAVIFLQIPRKKSNLCAQLYH